MNERILGFVNHLLKIHNISQNDFAIQCNYSRPYISRLLTSSQPVNQENLSIMLSVLGYDYMDVVSFIQTFPAKLVELYREMTFLDDEAAQTIFQRFNEYNALIPFTHHEYEYKIVSYIYFYTYDPEQADFTEFKQLEKDLHTVSERYQGLFYDYMAVTIKNENDYRSASKYIEKALKLDLPQEVLAMVYYHAGMIYERLGNLDLANKYNFDALRAFQSQNNSIRALAAQLHVANIHLKSNSLDMAYNQYLDTIDKAEQIGDAYGVMVCLYNLSLLSIKRHDYQKALEFLERIEQLDQLDEEGILQKCICLQRLGYTDDFNELYEKSLNLFTPDSPQLSELKILKFHADNQLKTDYINHLLSHVDKFSQSDDVDRTIRVYEHIIEYYESHRKYKAANKFLKKKSTLIGINPSI